MNDNPENNILMSENIRQKKRTVLEYIHQNILELLIFFV